MSDNGHVVGAGKCARGTSSRASEHGQAQRRRAEVGQQHGGGVLMVPGGWGSCRNQRKATHGPWSTGPAWCGGRSPAPAGYTRVWYMGDERARRHPRVARRWQSTPHRPPNTPQPCREGAFAHLQFHFKMSAAAPRTRGGIPCPASPRCDMLQLAFRGRHGIGIIRRRTAEGRKLLRARGHVCVGAYEGAHAQTS